MTLQIENNDSHCLNAFFKSQKHKGVIRTMHVSKTFESLKGKKDNITPMLLESSKAEPLSDSTPQEQSAAHTKRRSERKNKAKNTAAKKELKNKTKHIMQCIKVLVTLPSMSELDKIDPIVLKKIWDEAKERDSQNQEANWAPFKDFFESASE